MPLGKQERQVFIESLGKKLGSLGYKNNIVIRQNRHQIFAMISAVIVDAPVHNCQIVTRPLVNLPVNLLRYRRQSVLQEKKLNQHGNIGGQEWEESVQTTEYRLVDIAKMSCAFSDIHNCEQGWCCGNTFYLKFKWQYIR